MRSRTNLAKVHSEAEMKGVNAKTTKTEVGGGVEITYTGSVKTPLTHFTTVLMVLRALELLTHAWSYTGTCLVDSRTHWDEQNKCWNKVCQCHLSEALAYFDFVFRKAMAFKGPSDHCIAWITGRDRQTRAKAKAIHSEGFPWGRQ